MATLRSNQHNQNGYQVRQQQDDENFVAIRTRKYTKNLMVLGLEEQVGYLDMYSWTYTSWNFIRILHIINAVIIFGVGIAVIELLYHRKRYLSVNNHYTSIWVPWIFITTGILGTVIRCMPSNTKLVVAHNVFAIISAALTLPMIATSGYALNIYNCHSRERYFSYRYREFDHRNGTYFYKLNQYSYTYYDNRECRYHINGGRALHALIVILAIIEFIFAVLSTHSSFKVFNCCKQGCPGKGIRIDEHSAFPGTQVYQMQQIPIHSQCQQVIMQSTPRSILDAPPPYSAQAPTTGNQMYQAIPQRPSTGYQPTQFSGTTQCSQVQTNQTFLPYMPVLPAASLGQQPLQQQLSTGQISVKTPILIGPDGKQYALMEINTQTTNAALSSTSATSSTGNVPVLHDAFPSTASTEIVTPMQQALSTETSTVENTTSDCFAKDGNESPP